MKTVIAKKRYHDAMALVEKLKTQIGVGDSEVTYLFMVRMKNTMQNAMNADKRGWKGRVEFAGMDSLASPFTDMIPFTPRNESPEKMAAVAQDASLVELLYKGAENPPPTSSLLEEFGCAPISKL